MLMSKESAVGIFVIISLICVAYLTIKLGKMELVSSGGFNVNAQFSSVTGLKSGADIEIAGVKVGKVKNIKLNADEAMATVELQFNDGVKVFDDAIASVKTSGLIGDKYISVDPGGAGIELESGDIILDTESAVDIEALISKFVFGGV